MLANFQTHVKPSLKYNTVRNTLLGQTGLLRQVFGLRQSHAVWGEHLGLAGLSSSLPSYPPDTHLCWTEGIEDMPLPLPFPTCWTS